MKTFRAEKVKEQRRVKGVTQQMLATLVGVSRQSVNMWERGKKTPSSDSLMAMSEVLRVPVEYFFVRKYSSRNNKG